MVSGERVFQAARLFYPDNRRVIDRLDGGLESFRNQWTEVGDLRRTVEDQEQTISALEVRLARLERRERRRRSLEPEDDEVPIPVPPPPRRGGFGRYEGTDDSLRDPAEILQAVVLINFLKNLGDDLIND